MNRAVVVQTQIAPAMTTEQIVIDEQDDQVTHLVGSMSADQIGRFVAGLKTDNALRFTRIFKRYQNAVCTPQPLPKETDAVTIDRDVYELLEALTDKQLEATVGCLCETQLTLFFCIYRRYRQHHESVVRAARTE